MLQLFQLGESGLVQLRVRQLLELVDQRLHGRQTGGDDLAHGQVHFLRQVLVELADDDVVAELQLAMIRLLGAVMRRMSVVLPAPLRPIRQTRSPGSISNSTLLKIRWSPKASETSSRRTRTRLALRWQNGRQ